MDFIAFVLKFTHHILAKNHYITCQSHNKFVVNKCLLTAVYSMLLVTVIYSKLLFVTYNSHSALFTENCCKSSVIYSKIAHSDLHLSLTTILSDFFFIHRFVATKHSISIQS